MPSTEPRFRDLPVVMTDSTGNQFTTQLRYVNGTLTWVAVGITCLVASETYLHMSSVIRTSGNDTGVLISGVNNKVSCLLRCPHFRES